mgnify:CR=1 FL=1
MTKNGYGDMVVLSMEAFEAMQFDSEVYCKLKEAEREAEGVLLSFGDNLQGPMRSEIYLGNRP